MNITTLFEALTQRLVDVIPTTIAAMRLPDLICCLRVYYYDTHAPRAYLLLKPVTEAFRGQVLAEGGRSALYRLWDDFDPDAGVRDQPSPKRKGW
jgi:hypothetical protein